MRITNETSTKEELLDCLSTSDDLFDVLTQTPYDCNELFPDFAKYPEVSVPDKIPETSNIAINFSEIMADLVNLMSLDKDILALHQDVQEPSTKLPTEGSAANIGKRSYEAALGEDWFSNLPDHNYSSLNQKKPKTDDSAIDENEPIVEKPPQTTKSTKYMERRKKNNIASKRSRETRKNRFLEMEVQADQLEEENEKLRKQIEKLEALTQQMKDILVNRLSKGQKVADC